MKEFCMPSLGADMESGTLVEWMIKPGDHVERGQIVAEVETQKGNIEVEIWNAGTVEELLARPGMEIPVGQAMALLREEGETAETGPTRREEAPAPAASQHVEPPPPKPAPAPAPRLVVTGPPRTRRLRVTPLARRMAADLGVDVALVHGTGEGGAITKADVLGYREGHPEKPDAPKARHADRSAAMRRAIAAAMSKSKKEIPHYYLENQVDVRAMQAWINEQNQQRSVRERILPAALYIKAIARACGDVPELNGFWIDGEFHPSQSVHVGMGISLRQGGLIAPAIHDADTKSIDEIMRDLLDLVSRARTGKLRSSEIADATITVTSLGDRGVDSVFGVIYPPQVAIVGFGKIRNQPWVYGDLLGIAPVMHTTLAGDHRASDGHRGGIFLEKVGQYLADPAKYL